MQFSISNKTVTTTVMNKDHDEMEAVIQQISGHQRKKKIMITKRKQQQKQGKFKTSRRKKQGCSHLCTG